MYCPLENVICIYMIWSLNMSNTNRYAYMVEGYFLGLNPSQKLQATREAETGRNSLS